MMITQSELKELFHYCQDTGVFTHIKVRPKVVVGSVAGWVNKVQGYLYITVKKKHYSAHRLAWLYVYGTFPPEDIDHINRIRTDNRICNLRMATRSENMQNASIPRHNTSGHMGVNWHKQTQKWRAYISVNKKQIYLGLFSDISDAIAARKASEPTYHAFQHT